MARASDKETLLAWLQTALELELATIPPYMVALLSIRLPGNRASAEIIRSVMIEEMLHLVLIANVINAVGGKPRIDAGAIPTYPLQMQFKGKPFADRLFAVDLAPFSAAAISTFLQIELPHRPPRPELLEARVVVPALTIGEFYEKIVALLSQLDAEEQLFVIDTSRQIGEDFYWSGGGSIIKVTNLETAKAALNLVINQGEAASAPASSADAKFGNPLAMGHYFRFREIEAGRRFAPGDDPFGNPTGDSISVNYEAVYPIAISPTSAAYANAPQLAKLNHDFNTRYTTMLQEIEQGLNGAPKALYTAIMDGMHGLTPVAHEMMKLPIAGDAAGKNGCPTFEWLPA